MQGKRIRHYGQTTIVAALESIVAHGWYNAGITRAHAGSAGIFLEHLLGTTDPNGPSPDMGSWELKTRSQQSHSLLTLFQLEPFPRQCFMTRLLVERFGWLSGKRNAESLTDGRNFRQTLSCGHCTSRGFSLSLSADGPESDDPRLVLQFNPEAVAQSFSPWREELLRRKAHLQMHPQPYWRLSDIFAKAASKLSKCIYVSSRSKTLGNVHYVKYENFTMYSGLNLDALPDLLRSRDLVVYFNAQSGHNHGTQFRIKPGSLAKLYKKADKYGNW